MEDRSTRPSSGLRVVVLTTSFPRDAGDPAGHFVETEARSLLAAGHEVHVIAAGGRLRSDPNRREGLVLWHAGGGDAFATPGIAANLHQRPWRAEAVMRFGLGALTLLRRLAPIDELVAHWWLPCAWPLACGWPQAYGWPLPRSANLPRLTAVAHGADIRLLCKLPPPLRSHIVRQLLARCDTLRLVAHALRDELCRALPPKLAETLRQRTQIAPCTLEIPPPPNNTRHTPQPPTIVAVGRLVASKRLPLLLHALARCTPAPRCHIIGDGPERPQLSALAHRLQLHAVTFCGQLPRPQALDLIAGADLLVSCSAHEGAPTAVREARALGTPVLATAAGDIARWAESDSGIELVAPTAEALAQVLSQLAAAQVT